MGICDTTHIMNTTQNVTNQDKSAAALLGQALRLQRKKRKWTLVQLAEKIGRPREWLNRVELGYSDYGEHRPPSEPDLRSLMGCLWSVEDNNDEMQLLSWRNEAEERFRILARRQSGGGKKAAGKVIRSEVIVGEGQVAQAVTNLIEEQHSDAIIRNTGIKTPGIYVHNSLLWKRYGDALGSFLSKNPQAMLKRVEFVATRHQLEISKQSDIGLAGDRATEDVYNTKVKFVRYNPLQMHVLIGQREAILALPMASGHVGSNMALLIRDKTFVDALRVWYDEVLWDTSYQSRGVSFGEIDKSFEEIAQMYEFEEKHAEK